MSETTAESESRSHDALGVDTPLPPRRSIAARVLSDTFSRPTAAIGAVWLAIIAFCAVFAPFVASSHPILMKDADGVSSPMLEHLSAVDAILPLLLLAALIAWRLPGGFAASERWAGFGVIATFIIVGAILFCRPPELTNFQQYREGIAQGEIEWAVHTIIPYSPTDRLRDKPGLQHPLPPDSTHRMGTEGNGADILSRMIHASRIAVAIGFIATGIALVIGVIIGGLMGYFSGIVDLLGMRLVEVFAAIPQIFLLLSFVAFFGRNLYLMMVIIGVTSWMGYARFTRAEFLRLRQQDFVSAAVATGLPLRSVLFRHMLPNGVAPVLVEASFGVPSAILAETFLSFLGLGLVDEPSWGQLLSQAISQGGGFYWWIATFPGLAIFLTVFGFNLIGESLRDALDPKTTGEA